MKRTIAFLLASAFVGASTLVGCGNEPTNESSRNAPPAALALTDLGSMMSNLFCGLAFSCCTSNEQNVLFNDFGAIPDTVAECKPLVKQQFDTYIFSGLNAAVNAGRLKYDAVAAKACLDQMQGQCTTIMAGAPLTGPGCEKVFTGLVADGGTCAADLECRTPGSLCAIAQNAQTGKCQPAPKEGQPCINYACAEGLVCGFVNNADVCVKILDNGATCTSSFDCMSGNCSAGTCAAQRNLGDACEYSIECNNSYCDSQTNTCQTLKADGASCMYSDECESARCAVDTNTCVTTLQCNGT